MAHFTWTILTGPQHTDIAPYHGGPSWTLAWETLPTWLLGLKQALERPVPTTEHICAHPLGLQALLLPHHRFFAVCSGPACPAQATSRTTYQEIFSDTASFGVAVRL